MSDVPYKTPTFQEAAFNCPTCNAYSHHQWHQLRYFWNEQKLIANAHVAFCSHLRCASYWVDKTMIWPAAVTAPLPERSLSAENRSDFEEARQIVARSPRGACALLRLCVQRLCIELGHNGSDLYGSIATMVSNGLNPTIQKSLDIVRVIGNEAVHPGEMDLRDDKEIAEKLFVLVNLISRQMVTEPAEIGAMYETLPESKRLAIEQRDKNPRSD